MLAAALPGTIEHFFTICLVLTKWLIETVFSQNFTQSLSTTNLNHAAPRSLLRSNVYGLLLEQSSRQIEEVVQRNYSLPPVWVKRTKQWGLLVRLSLQTAGKLPLSVASWSVVLQV